MCACERFVRAHTLRTKPVLHLIEYVQSVSRDAPFRPKNKLCVVVVVVVVVVDVCSHSLSSNALLRAGCIFFIHKHAHVYLMLRPTDRRTCAMRSSLCCVCVHVAHVRFCVWCVQSARSMVMSFLCALFTQRSGVVVVRIVLRDAFRMFGLGFR